MVFDLTIMAANAQSRLHAFNERLATHIQALRPDALTGLAPNAQGVGHPLRTGLFQQLRIPNTDS